jgi:hypothetical protein
MNQKRMNVKEGMEKRERPSNKKNAWRKETEEKVMHATPNY